MTSNDNIFRVTGHFAGNSPVSGEFPAQMPVTRSFDVFLSAPEYRLSEHSSVWWFETPSPHYEVTVMSTYIISASTTKPISGRYIVACIVKTDDMST